MPNDMLYHQSAQPHQRSFHNAVQKYRAIGGGVGSGKTAPGVVEAIAQSWEHPNNYGFILRKTFPELRISTQKDFFDLCPPWLIQKRNRTENWVDLLNWQGATMVEANGKKPLPYDTLVEGKGVSRVEFISFENTQEAYDKFQSANIGWFMIDQAEEASKDIFDALVSRMRRDPSGRRAWFIYNPAGHNWLWKLFHPHSQDHNPDLFWLVDTKTSDNPFLPEDYEESLLATYSKDKIERYLMGSYEAYTGMVYKQFNLKTHVVDPFPIPDDWDIGVGLDHGLNNPTAAVFCAKDPDGNIFMYNEHYQEGWLVSEHAEYLKPLIPSNCWMKVIDPSTQSREPISGKTVIGEYAKAGIFWIAGNNDVAAGINRCGEYLNVDPKRRHPLTKQFGAPRFFVMRNCKHFIDEILDYQWQRLKTSLGESNEPERPRKKEDHLMDAWRYWMLMFSDEIKQPTRQSEIPDHIGEYKIIKAGVEIDPAPNIKVAMKIKRKKGGWLSA